MIRIPTPVVRWLATASVCTLIGAVAPSTAGASAPPPPVPTGYVALVDDTNHIAIMVPPTWTDVQTGPVDVATGSAPHISASPNIQSFLDTFDTPGVRYIAFPYTPDPNTLVDQYGLEAGCASITTQPYDDPGFVGVVQVGTGCGTAGQATWNMVAASRPDQSFTAVVQIQTASPADQPDVDAVLTTFGAAPLAPTPVPAPVATAAAVPTDAPVATVVPAPSAPTPTVAAVPTIPTPTVAATATPVPTTVAPVPATVAPVPATAAPVTAPVAPTPTVAGATAAPAQGITLTDDTGLLTVQVPAAWIYHSTAPTDSGRPVIAAMTQVQDLDYTMPSLVFIGGDYVADTSIAIANLGADALGCTANPAEPYNDNVFVGHMQTYTRCGGSEAMRVFVVANPPSQSTTVTLMITMPVFDEAALSLILQTFTVTR